MEIKDLELKVEKAEEKVEKCKKTIERHKKQLEKKIQSCLADYEIKWKEEDIKGATRKLEDAERILESWNTKLLIEIEKKRFIEGNTPQVIKDFLEDWKRMAFDWHVKKYNDFQNFKIELKEKQLNARIECVKTTPEYAEYLDENGEVKDYYNNEYNLMNLYPRKYMDSYLSERGLDSRTVDRSKTAFAGFTVLKMCEIRNEEERLSWLDKRLETEKKEKTIDLINRINKVVGSITDAKGLSISEKGNLDGTIIGEKGEARIETVGAGGWNIQCFHFRTLVHKL